MCYTKAMGAHLFPVIVSSKWILFAHTRNSLNINLQNLNAYNIDEINLNIVTGVGREGQHNENSSRKVLQTATMFCFKILFGIWLGLMILFARKS